MLYKLQISAALNTCILFICGEGGVSMSITVADAYKLHILQNVTILTGESGFQNVIDRMGILDYEFISYKMKGEFIQNDFVLSSFLFAKDDINLLVAAVKALIDNGVSCLGIKSVYYKELPADLIQYAIDHSFSIFLFGHDIYFEDIITEVMDTLRSIDSQLLVEMKIDNLINNELSRTLVRDLALEINPCFGESICVAYCEPLQKKGDHISCHVIDRLAHTEYFQKENGKSALLKYKCGMLAILTHSHGRKVNPHTAVQEFITETKLDFAEYRIGVSNEFQQLHFLDKAIRESLYAVQLCFSEKGNICYYADIGLYKLILPYFDTFWLKEFYTSIIEPLKSYDAKYSADLLQTAVIYVQQGGSIKKTAEELFQHENTIRYRINKIRDILHLEGSMVEFHAQLSIAVKIELLGEEL